MAVDGDARGHPSPSAFVHTGEWQVPAFTSTEIRPSLARVCACVFVLNEGPRLTAQLTRMQPYTDQVDVIVADGGSTDGSTDAAGLATLGVRALLVKHGPGRLSAQMRMAYAFAMRTGYEAVISMDGNNKDDPAAIPLFLEALDRGYDHVQGSRYITGGRGINTPMHRTLGVRLLHAPLISLSAGRLHTDTTNGFRAYSRALLTDPRVAPFRDVFLGYELHYYLAIRASRLGFRMTEVPVTRAYPSSGPTPTKISFVRGNLEVLRTLMAAALHRYDPRAGEPGADDDG